MQVFYIQDIKHEFDGSYVIAYLEDGYDVMVAFNSRSYIDALCEQINSMMSPFYTDIFKVVFKGVRNEVVFLNLIDKKMENKMITKASIEELSQKIESILKVTEEEKNSLDKKRNDLQAVKTEIDNAKLDQQQTQKVACATQSTDKYVKELDDVNSIQNAISVIYSVLGREMEEGEAEDVAKLKEAISILKSFLSSEENEIREIIDETVPTKESPSLDAIVPVKMIKIAPDSSSEQQFVSSSKDSGIDKDGKSDKKKYKKDDKKKEKKEWKEGKKDEKENKEKDKCKKDGKCEDTNESDDKKDNKDLKAEELDSLPKDLDQVKKVDNKEESFKVGDHVYLKEDSEAEDFGEVLLVDEEKKKAIVDFGDFVNEFFFNEITHGVEVEKEDEEPLFENKDEDEDLRADAEEILAGVEKELEKEEKEEANVKSSLSFDSVLEKLADSDGNNVIHRSSGLRGKYIGREGAMYVVKINNKEYKFLPEEIDII